MARISPRARTLEEAAISRAFSGAIAKKSGKGHFLLSSRGVSKINHFQKLSKNQNRGVGHMSAPHQGRWSFNAILGRRTKMALRDSPLKEPGTIPDRTAELEKRGAELEEKARRE
jgi:hypothetical protein